MDMSEAGLESDEFAGSELGPPQAGPQGEPLGWGEHISDLRKVRLCPDFWYPLALSSRLQKGQTLGVTFAGEPIAFVRTETGKVFALEDRCAHRQFPLSQGVVCGDRLQCGYHAWVYDETGKIRHLPYLAKGSKVPRGVQSYPCHEAYGWIFVFPGHPDLAATTRFPELPLWHSRDYKPMYFSRQVNCHYSFLHENLLDMNHQFLHRRLMGRIKPELLGHDRGEDWVEARYHFHYQGGRRHRGADWLSFGATPDEKNYDVMTIRTDYPYQTLQVSGVESSVPSIFLWACYVPKDRDQRVNQSFGILLVRKPKIPGLIYLLWPILRHFAESVFREDRAAVEAEQRAYEAQGGDWNQEVYPVILDVRAVLRRCGIAAGV
jgi:phenylpropionate dioxygenase-like ring-hydroxylating dioxygenase large terminal subunit